MWYAFLNVLCCIAELRLRECAVLLCCAVKASRRRAAGGSEKRHGPHGQSGPD